MAKTVADQFAEILVAAGVKRIYGIVGDSLNGLTDSEWSTCRRPHRSRSRRTGTPVGVVLAWRSHPSGAPSPAAERSVDAGSW
jgi:hypothetical protein